MKVSFQVCHLDGMPVDLVDFSSTQLILMGILVALMLIIDECQHAVDRLRNVAEIKMQIIRR